MPFVLREHGWLATFFSATEGMPVGCTLSSVEADNVSFPLIYANKRFEEMAGCPRSHLVGKSCTFLQTKQTCQLDDQQISIDQLVGAVKNSREYISCVTCSNASKALFKSVIGVKPIRMADAEDGRRFFITFQIGLHGDDCIRCKDAITQVMDLIKALPY